MTIQDSTIQDRALPLSSASLLPWLQGPVDRVLAWRNGSPIQVGYFLGQARALADELGSGSLVVNLCEDRYAFLLVHAASLLDGRSTIMPPSRAAGPLAEILAQHPQAVGVSDHPGHDALDTRIIVPATLSTDPQSFQVGNPATGLPADHVVAIAYTSGSHSQPQAHCKHLIDLQHSNAGNQRLLSRTLGPSFNILATVPPQHMYGFELSVILPLLSSGIAMDCAKPLLPAEVRSALQHLPAPRLLVTTPLHLQALLRADLDLDFEAAVSATAPLDPRLAMAVEARWKAPMLEVYGSTETCVFASRRPAQDPRWSPYADVHIEPRPDGARIRAPQLPAPVVLADLIELESDGRFHLRGRCADLLEIAGKRASLADLNRRLLSISGIEDGVIFQHEAPDVMGVKRLAALVVAPTLHERQIREYLSEILDPAFMPRPLRRVTALPHNATGKLPKAELMALLRAGIPSA